MLFLASKKMGWRDFEVSDNTRGVIKTTVSLKTATAPTATLRRRLRAQLDSQPHTIGALWTKNQTTTKEKNNDDYESRQK